MDNCLWFNLLRKTVIIATFYFAAEKIVCVRKKWVAVNSMSHILMQAFICSTYSDFHMEKIASFKYAKFQEQYVELPKILVY